MIEIERYISPQNYSVSSEHFVIEVLGWVRSGDKRASIASRRPKWFSCRRRKNELEYKRVEGEYTEESKAAALRESKAWAIETIKGLREELAALLELLEEDT